MLFKKKNQSTDKLVNFVPPAFDRLSLGLRLGFTYGVGATIIVIVVIIATSSYVLHLQNELSKLHDQIKVKAQEVQALREFEYKYLETQEKLDIYAQISTDEKMAELFPKLSALIPDGVKVHDLVITPDKVEIDGDANSQFALSLFVTNLKQASNLVFADGQKITITEPNVREIMKNPDKSGNDAGYKFSLIFYYQVN